MRPSSLLLLSSLLALTSSATFGQTIHVAADAPGDPGPGTPFISDPLEDGTAAHPFDEIQEGIDAAVSGDTVLVQSGTYFFLSTIDLSGGQGSSKILTIRSVAGPQKTVIDATSINDHALQAISGESTATIFEGFTVKGGSADGSTANIDRGGGLLLLHSGLTVRNCIFSENTATFGAGIYCNAATLIIENTQFTFNHASSRGGGIYGNASNLTVYDCSFELNTAPVHGGAIYSNRALRDTVRCDFIGNIAGGSGGAVWLEDGTSAALIKQCRFLGNQADGGPGVQTWGVSQHALVWNCLFSGNESLSTGAGACTAGDNTSINVYNSTFVNSFTAATGHPNLDGTISVINSILRTGSALQVQGFSTNVTYSNVSGGYTGTGNIDTDPQFRNPLGRDGLAGTVDDQLSLLPNSPCIDAGNAFAVAAYFSAIRYPVDLAGNPRVQGLNSVPDTGIACLGEAVDMGCYEFPASCIQEVGTFQVP